MLYNTPLDAICMAPVVKISNLFPNHNVWLKGDFIQPHSIISERSNRVANYIINKEIRNHKKFTKKKPILVLPIENPTTISLARVGVLRGFQVLGVSPENLSKKYMNILNSYKVDMCYTPAHLGTREAVKIAHEIATQNQEMWIPKYNKKTMLIEALAYEIKKDFPQGLDYIVMPTSTPSYANLFAFIIKKIFPHIKVFMAIPKNQLVHTQDHARVLKHINGIILASPERAQHITDLITIKEGLPNNITSGLSFNAVEKLIIKHTLDSTISIMAFQTGL